MVVEFDKDEGAGEEDLKRVRVAIVDSFFSFYFLISPLILYFLAFFFPLYFSRYSIQTKKERRNNKPEEKKRKKRKKRPEREREYDKSPRIRGAAVKEQQ